MATRGMTNPRHPLRPSELSGELAFFDRFAGRTPLRSTSSTWFPTPWPT
jgi:hypothetical protein